MSDHSTDSPPPPPFSLPRPNVYEVHSSALHICLPFDTSAATSLTSSPCTPAIHNGSAWLVIVIDDLSQLSSYVGFGRFLPTGMGGWMSKLNLLVNCPVPSSPSASSVPGYQILSLDFERSPLAGRLKKLGARLTQKVPAHTSDFSSSLSSSDLSMSMSRPRFLSGAHKHSLVEITGSLSPPSPSELPLIEFVAKRPHKFLHQHKSSIAWSPWGDGWESPTEDVKRVDATTLDVAFLLKRELPPEIAAQVDPSKAFCFLQPQYILIDLHNTTLPPC
ncbi:hypothetical protein TeGR_g4802 [Tetraparma gracilis]|uniref:Uncharacterized protein n=1 Tax=Tetraparma gracilis TaxID=2962635 RepID=A0ABQ6MJH1_9STRA|nr:hypothetical protein TeGR_g4802 [Tetraparma gracilis]